LAVKVLPLVVLAPSSARASDGTVVESTSGHADIAPAFVAGTWAIRVKDDSTTAVATSILRLAVGTVHRRTRGTASGDEPCPFAAAAAP
jgi:hypothetical protein